MVAQANPNPARVASRWIQRAQNTSAQSLMPVRHFVEKHELAILGVFAVSVTALSGTGLSIVSSLWSIVSAIGTLTMATINLTILLGLGLGLVAAAGGARTRKAFARLRVFFVEENVAGEDRN